MANAIRAHNVRIAVTMVVVAAALMVLVAATPAQAAFPDETFPDGHNPVAFEKDGDIWVASKMHLANLTPGTADSDEADPSVSPDGAYVAFASDRAGDFEIYTANVHTGNVRRITDNSVDDHDPAWSLGGLGNYVTSEVRWLGTLFTEDHLFIQ